MKINLNYSFSNFFDEKNKRQISQSLLILSKIVAGVTLITFVGYQATRCFFVSNSLHFSNKLLSSNVCHELSTDSLYFDKSRYAIAPIYKPEIQDKCEWVKREPMFKGSSHPSCQNINLEEEVLRILTNTDPLKIISPSLSVERLLEEGEESYLVPFKKLQKCGFHSDKAKKHILLGLAEKRLHEAKHRVEKGHEYLKNPDNANLFRFCNDVYKNNIIPPFSSNNNLVDLIKLKMSIFKIFRFSAFVIFDSCQENGIFDLFKPIPVSSFDINRWESVTKNHFKNFFSKIV